MLKQLLRRIRRRPNRCDFEFVPEGWRRAQQAGSIKGWNVESVVATQRARWENNREPLYSARPLGSTREASGGERCDLAAHNALVSFAYVAAFAARMTDTLSLLDWGGGSGQYRELTEAILPGVHVDYFCKDVAVQCQAGRKLSPESTFFENDDQFESRKFDLVLASGALQYVENWQAVLSRLVAATGKYLFITRLPTVQEAESFVVLQHAQAYGYDTEYLGWCLNRNEFLGAAQDLGAHQTREFVLEPPCLVPGSPEAYQTRGFLFDLTGGRA